MDRRRFLTGSAGFAATAAAGQLTPHHRHSHSFAAREFALDEITISELQERMAQGRLSAERATELYLDRIREIDHHGPELRSVIEINPDALAIAKELDKERKAGRVRGPLHGIPVLLKDNIDTADKMQTTAGSLALVGSPARRDAFLVGRLRDAGAVLLGKTNLSEWANFRSTHSTSGWSGRGGQTKNPYALDRNPCGSSSGSGAAVSANLTSVAVGTETDGSVICPSSICGIVGIKPTLGLISRSGIIPIAHSQDTAGPMARSVRDAAIVLGVLAGVDERDAATAGARGNIARDYTSYLDPTGLKGARIGFVRQYLTMGPAVSSVMDDCIHLLKDAGAEIVDPVEFPKFEEWRDTETEVLLYEFKADLNAYLADRGAGVKSLADCIAFNRAHRSEEMPYFAQELMEQAQGKGPLTEKAYKDALDRNHRLTRKEGIDALLKKYKLDALAGPTAGPAWTTDWVNGDRVDSGCSSPPAVSGYPHITVPAGQVFGLPVGFSFFAEAWSEPKLIKLAYAFEQLRKARTKPGFSPTLDFSA
ncbi:MAG TPA: amidase [Bryobacteraceae bacterium]|jgi:amidase|nr:amidase [Bryobacteraceae bacterium]